MLWITWRQHRYEILIMGALLAIACTFLLITGLQMRDDFHQAGGNCPVDINSACQLALGRYQRYDRYFDLLLIVPVLIGMLIGGPFIAREYEQRTHLFIWAQSITRRRWVMTKLAFVISAWIITGGIFEAMLSWWYEPLLSINNAYNKFDLIGTVPIAYSLFAVALGIMCGALFKRTVLAMVITLFAFPVIRVFVERLRPNWLTPNIVYFGIDAQQPAAAQSGWIINFGYSDAQGRPLSDAAYQACANLDSTQYQSCIQSNHWQMFTKFFPLSDFGAFQAIETTIFGLLALLLLSIACWRIIRAE
jgi:ABC-type transport system involved in multi-copper enzyme maturation permease subunit